MATYTTDDLIQYLYYETPEEKTKAIQQALQTDWSLKEQFEALKDTRQGLDKIIAGPRPQSVAAILDYARTSTEIAQP